MHTRLKINSTIPWQLREARILNGTELAALDDIADTWIEVMIYDKTVTVDGPLLNYQDRE